MGGNHHFHPLKAGCLGFQAVAEIFLTTIEQPQKQLETSVKKPQDSEFDVHEMDQKSADRKSVV